MIIVYKSYKYILQQETLYNRDIKVQKKGKIMTWGYKCDRINKLQNKAIRIVSLDPLSKYNAHTEPICKRLQLLKVADILKIQELKCYYRL